MKKVDVSGGLRQYAVYWLGPGAGVPFTFRPIYIRVVSSNIGGSTPWGMVWINGYELTERGDTGSRREVLAILAGCVPVLDESAVFPKRMHSGRQVVRSAR